MNTPSQKSQDNYLFQNVWNGKKPEIKAQIIGFWTALGALPKSAKAEERVEQVVFVIMDKQKQVVGVSTVYSALVPTLGFHMLHFRCLIHPEHRQNNLAKDIVLKTWTHFNEQANSSDSEVNKGIIMEVENPVINKNKPEAVWTDTQMVYIGKSSRGLPIRVRYFDGAIIN
ncbi:hypothetical protein N7E81_13800 [Reichenbachiella carrageenanivorans]|uniref:N-acetyltransferase domain-containing protein n=1 Tax=Reichenbachiella carrageenanivorans TaxID=2979869 RepID=A0ABY6CWX8_9BACT|nr:hypothetical protein [Reichenbachiella carrageenanivorans]UXX78431.1 hypothetical protein N7E81_13800 [Reichenbachiella carrageenanivorans]